MLKQNQDEFSYHELLDRTSVVISIMEQQLLEHDLLKSVETDDLQDIKSTITDAISKLAEAYQQIGLVRFKG